MAVMEITNDPAPGVALLIVQVASFFCGVAKITEVAETVEFVTVIIEAPAAKFTVPIGLFMV